MLKAALAGKVLQKGKLQYSTNFQKWNISAGWTPAWSPPSSRTDFEVASAAVVATLVAAQGSVFGRRSGPAALSLCLSPLGASAAAPRPCTPECAGHRGRADPPWVSSPLTVTLVPPPSQGWATKFLLQLVKLCFSLPADFFFLMMTLNSLYLER